jgi:hypothetical protein
MVAQDDRKGEFTQNQYPHSAMINESDGVGWRVCERAKRKASFEKTGCFFTSKSTIRKLIP